MLRARANPLFGESPPPPHFRSLFFYTKGFFIAPPYHVFLKCNSTSLIFKFFFPLSQVSEWGAIGNTLRTWWTCWEYIGNKTIQKVTPAPLKFLMYLEERLQKKYVRNHGAFWHAFVPFFRNALHLKKKIPVIDMKNIYAMVKGIIGWWKKLTR